MTNLLIILNIIFLMTALCGAQLEYQKFRECGLNSKMTTALRIIGGRPSNPKDWPWMAAIALKPLTRLPFCGGTVITDKHVLTAAHCIDRHPMNEIRVRLGETDFNKPDESDSEDFEVDQYRKHENYNSATFENDIAILILKRTVIFSHSILPVCLPPPNRKFEDEAGFVAGWGARSFGGRPNSELNEVLIKVWKQSECVRAYPKRRVTDEMMCCGWTSDDADSCQGDSGGPFMVQIPPTNRWHVAGIVSWGQLCGVPNHPGVYTRVNKYLEWIEVNTQSASPQHVGAGVTTTKRRPFDCSEVCPSRRNCKSGVYSIYPTIDRSVEVFCDMTTRGGGWTVLLYKDKDKTPQENFRRGSPDYKNGFGDASKEYWIGNENLYRMTNERNYSLRIDAKSKEYDDAWAEFRAFKFLPESANYKILFEGISTGSLIYDGNGGLSLRGVKPLSEGSSFVTTDEIGIHGTFYPPEESTGKWTADNPLGSFADIVVMMMRLRRDL